MVLTVNKRRALRIVLAWGGLGLVVPCALSGIARCCIDQASPNLAVEIYNKLFSYLWPTSSLIPPYLFGGPVDRGALLRSVAMAVATNALVYSIAGLVISVLWARLADRVRHSDA